MNNFKNFTLYTPEKPDVPGAMYLKSEEGHDWYACQSLFKADTYNSAKVITSVSRDVSTLWPVDQSVAELPDTEENRKVDISGRWGFDGEKITDLLTVEKAREQKGSEINA